MRKTSAFLFLGSGSSMAYTLFKFSSYKTGDSMNSRFFATGRNSFRKGSLRPLKSRFRPLRSRFRRLFITCDVCARDFFVVFPWFFRGPHLLGKTVFGRFPWLFRGPHLGQSIRVLALEKVLKGPNLICNPFKVAAYAGPYPQYGWHFPEEIPEKFRKDPRKRSESVSWNSRREYGWDAPNPIIQGI